MAFFSRNNLSTKKDGEYMINVDDRKVKEHSGFHSFRRYKA